MSLTGHDVAVLWCGWQRVALSHASPSCRTIHLYANDITKVMQHHCPLPASIVYHHSSIYPRQNYRHTTIFNRLLKETVKIV